MDTLEAAFAALGEKTGLDLAFDDAGACELPLADGRHLHLQIRGDVGEVIFVATLGSVPEAVRGKVFKALLAANYYWNETAGGTLSWQDEIEQVVFSFPLSVASVDSASLERVFENFLNAQGVWAERLANDIQEAEAVQEMEAAEARAENGEDAETADSLMPPRERLQMIYG